ncbi:hypothetical protein F5Y16DRAFT_2023 [Xylariaceae sp. FL0255]|nr:hypothetical protein F5Y16DRAFT_2023 [Xylariaceae sp. FL0255]
MIIKDDEDYHEEEIDRSLSLKDVRELGGTTVFESLDYEANNILNERQFDEESPDDEDHTGFTGNEGATATYWYRNTVCLVVPQAFLDKFRFQGKDKWRWALKQLQELRRSPSPINLVWLCQFLLQANRAPETYYMFEYGYGSHDVESTAQEACLKEISCIALEANRLDIFELAFQRQKGPLPTESFYHLGRCLTLLKPEEADKTIYPALHRCQGLASKHNAFEQLTEGFNEASESLSRNSIDTWRRWLEKKMLPSILAGVGELTREDGKALSTIYSKISDEHNSRTHIRQQVAQGSMAAKIGFCIQLAQQHLIDESAPTVVREVLCHIWSEFRLDNARVAPGMEPIPLPKTADKDFPTPHDIIELVRLVGAHGDSLSSELEHGTERTISNTLDSLGLSRNDCPAKILSACEAADHMDVVGTWLPFVQLVVSNQVPFLLTPEDKEPTDVAKKIVRCIIQRFTKLVIGKRPECPTTWNMRSVSSCGCPDCRAVNAFLTSPTERIGWFPMSKQRRHHLHTHFNDHRHSGVDYNIETIRGCNPNIWQMTKTRTGYDAQLKQWKTKRSLAWPLLSQLVSDQPDSELVEEFMGADMFKAIQAKDLNMLFGRSEPLLTLKDTNAFGKRARPSDGLATQIPAKRVASENARALHPVIDLTGE